MARVDFKSLEELELQSGGLWEPKSNGLSKLKAIACTDRLRVPEFAACNLPDLLFGSNFSDGFEHARYAQYNRGLEESIERYLLDLNFSKAIAADFGDATLWMRSSLSFDSATTSKHLTFAGVNASSLSSSPSRHASVAANVLARSRRSYSRWYLHNIAQISSISGSSLVVGPYINVGLTIYIRVSRLGCVVQIKSEVLGGKIETFRWKVLESLSSITPPISGPLLQVFCVLEDLIKQAFAIFESDALDIECVLDKFGVLWCTQCRYLPKSLFGTWSVVGEYKYSRVIDCRRLRDRQFLASQIQHGDAIGCLLACNLVDEKSIDLFDLMQLVAAAPKIQRRIGLYVFNNGDYSHHLLLAATELMKGGYVGQGAGNPFRHVDLDREVEMVSKPDSAGGIVVLN